MNRRERKAIEALERRHAGLADPGEEFEEPGLLQDWMVGVVQRYLSPEQWPVEVADAVRDRVKLTRHWRRIGALPPRDGGPA